MILARATTEVDDPTTAPRRIPGVYADPVAWLLADVVHTALADCETTSPSRVGVIAVSEFATRDTLRQIADSAANGRVSPMRFAAAGPGSPVGLICSVFGFQGPTAVLPMPKESARTVIEALLADWLSGARPCVEQVVVVTHELTEDGGHRAECVVRGRTTPTPRSTDR
ncbi:hypothetical protein NLX83_29505 [Allokutzneria sp. A3M-2-11 16]|uniref:hypothetical protein n=1 Tax=Allokutzneria sp. A3M-2-11 16 TaxID=2962043 RepID=UPI0020B7AF01|nr:hypothetical protein [Allokutzneria sp. A3M-2-11 16]MCP3803419.1 hypothetical protein [Allokutzneria sp. A3M-2-11 16]